MRLPQSPVNADEEFYKIAVCGKTACTVRRRGVGTKALPLLYTL
jgi:hypothetical protein